MKLGLINSAWAQAGRDTAYGIRQTKAIGFDTIDIFADPLDTGVKERLLIKPSFRVTGSITIRVMGQPSFSAGLATAFPADSARSASDRAAAPGPCNR